MVTVFVALIAALFMIRRPRADGRPGLITALFVSITRGDRRGRQQVVSEFVPALVAIAGTNALFVQGIVPVTHTSALLTIPGAALGLLGICFAIWSLASLGRCFGILPEARGLVTRGPYARIRHPLYLAEIISTFGGLLSTLSLSTVPLFALFVGLQYWRARNEERVLRQTFPEYAEYQQRTWRILPGVH
ncbi:MAG: hypothetical protein HW416_1279 [Chloroflexi bacterium]|nr:hypothetical protein [Chloroflexota bacterium]